MLYICATPIGNLEDITIRTLNTLSEVDYIACEDTRRTLKLLNHYDIKKKLVSLNEHNEFQKRESILEDLKKGMNIALVSDAGMPGIQDPGQLLIQLAIEHNIAYTVLPGASALITALVGSGVSKDEFLFLGFLPRKKNERLNILNQYADFFGEIILYEAPHRFAKLIDDIHSVFGNRKIVIAREISKLHEEYIHTDLESAIKHYREIKGEIVLIIERGEQQVEEIDIQDLAEIIYRLSEEGHSTKEITKILVKEYNLSKNEAYDLVITHKR